MGNKCRVVECNRKVLAREVCSMHYARLRRGKEIGPPQSMCAPHGAGNKNGYIGGRNGKYLHVHIAEKALGHALPVGVEVHHIDGNRARNVGGNLVICPSRTYHRLIHRRQRAFDSCGHPDWGKCWVCKKYDDPMNMYHKPNGTEFYHKVCVSQYNRQRLAA